MTLYEVDILDTKDDSVRRTPMWCGWSEQGSLDMYRTKMCDCNLHGYRERGAFDKVAKQWIWHTHAHEMVASNYKGCDHAMPPERYKALRAYLADGRVVNLQSGETTRAAA